MVQSKLSLSVVVPVYNSEASLRPLVARLSPVLSAIAPEHELILVNDGSRDGSWKVVQELAMERPWIRGIDMLRNYGQHNALLCGIRAAKHAVVVTMDDDLQNPPEEIEKLLAALDRGFDVAYGTPHKERHGFLRDMASQMTKLALQKSMGAETARKVSAFRALRTPLRGAFADFRGPYVSIDVLLTWATSKFTAVEVRHDAREQGASNYTMGKLVSHALNMITGFSVIPLRVASVIGFVFMLLGAGILVYVIYYKLTRGIPVQGYASLASMIAIFSGAQLFSLGIIGEYMARMHFRMMDRPSYAVRGSTSVTAESEKGGS
jgi:undecaprenyl-phosphate 4-deoxy-4-formamido-L-arabinose transferase